MSEDSPACLLFYKMPTGTECRKYLLPHLPEAEYDVRTIQELMERKDVATTMIYTHVLNKGGHGVSSPLDGLW